MTLTRREFCRTSAYVALGAAVFAGGLSRFGLLDMAQAQAQATPSQADLMAPGQLPDMTMGKADAAVTVIEYASTTCPHCSHFYATTFPELKKRYIDTGKIHYIYREFVLNQLDAAAVMLLRCTDKDKYFPLLDALFQKQSEWVVQKPLPPLLAIAKQAGFSEESFNQCLSNQALLDKIDAMRRYATDKIGVNSTPTFFVNGKKLQPGDMSIDDLAKEIDPLLKS